MAVNIIPLCLNDHLVDGIQHRTFLTHTVTCRHKNVSLLRLFVCLSLAGLGKYSVFEYKRHKKAVSAPTETLPCRSISLCMYSPFTLRSASAIAGSAEPAGKCLFFALPMSVPSLSWFNDDHVYDIMAQKVRFPHRGDPQH